jgi:rRNA processing protein Gar1
MISIKRVDANTFEATLKKAGKMVGTSKVVVSADGKTTTLTAKIMDASGKSVGGTSVYDKQ